MTVWQPEIILWLVIGLITGLLVSGIFFRQIRRAAPPSKNIVLDEAANDLQIAGIEPVSARVLLAAMMGSLREGVIVVGEEMLIIGSNQAAQAIFSHCEPPLEGKRLTELTRNLNVHQAFSAAIEGGARTEINVETRHDSDDKRMLDLRVAPLRFETAAEPRSAIGIFYDISQLEKLEKVRQEFLSNVSHELRTPLTSILAFVETLEDGAINDGANNLRFLSVIRKNAERMHRLINDTLELSAIEAGKITVEPMEINLAALVEDIADNLAAKAEAVKVKINNGIAEDVHVFADADRLEQMLTNLIDNAIKFNRENGSVIVSYSSNKDRDCIHIADTGEGILPDHVTRIFERFYRVDRARTTREIGGTGLGLAIVKHLAKLHGGEASVISELNKGSIFTVELPKSNRSEPPA